MTEPRVYPDKLEVKPLERPPNTTVSVPGSKSITNRALILAALASRDGDCQLKGALQSDDTEAMVACLRRLGFQIEPNWTAPEPTIHIQRNRGELIPVREADLFVGDSGTTMRFLTAIVAAGRGRFRLDGSPRMRERPIGDLLTALQQLSVNAKCEHGDGYPPVMIETNGLDGGHVEVRGDVSSQFLSGLLMAAPFASRTVTIQVEGPLVSQPYVDMTIGQMSRWGLHVESTARNSYRIQSQSPRQQPTETIEADASAASYFFAAATIAGGSVTVCGYNPPNITQQGDMEFLSVMERMGCKVERGQAWNVAHGSSRIRGIDIDMNAMSDCVPTLAAVACFAEGPTTIRNVAHIRHKESDRIAALATELRKLGAEVDELPDGLRITPRPLHGAEIETYNDHRIAMSMALIGLKVPGVVIKNPGCVAKTYPGFWEDLEKLRNWN